MKMLLLLIPVLLINFAIGQEKTPTSNRQRGEKTWKMIKNHAFSFSLPPMFEKTDAKGIDSFVEEYRAEGIALTFDYGNYSNNFEDWPKNTKYEELMVDGRTAIIGTVARKSASDTSYSTQIHIAVYGSVALSMHATCKSESEVVLAKKIFKTLAFKLKKEEQ